MSETSQKQGIHISNIFKNPVKKREIMHFHHTKRKHKHNILEHTILGKKAALGGRGK